MTTGSVADDVDGKSDKLNGTGQSFLLNPTVGNTGPPP